MGNAGDPVLEARGISVRFGGIVAVADVSLSFCRGMTTGLIGPNGAGKTTMFDALSGIYSPSAGRIVLHGSDVTSRSATWRARHGIRRTFQRTQTFGWLTVEQNLLAALEWRGGGGGFVADLCGLPGRRALERQRRQRVDEVIELCGLGAIRTELAGTLPIGSARIVEVGRALVDRPDVLLLDEPTSGLQENEVDRVGELIRQARLREGFGVVLVEHDIGFVLRQCDRIAVLNLGELLAVGTPDEVTANQDVVDAYLG